MAETSLLGRHRFPEDTEQREYYLSGEGKIKRASNLLRAGLR